MYILIIAYTICFWLIKNSAIRLTYSAVMFLLISSEQISCINLLGNIV